MRLGAGDGICADRPWWWPRLPGGAPPPGLVAAYAFDEGSGTTAVDASGNGRNGAVVGATWATGRYGGALSFDGTNDYVGLPGLGTFYNAAFTLEAWVQKATTKNDVGIVGTWAGNGPMLWVDHLATPPPRSRSAAASPRTSTPARNPIVGQWQHLAATFDGTTARFYVDGAEVAIAGGLRQRRQLEHLADRRLRQRRRRLLRRAHRRDPRLRPRARARPRSQADRDQPLGHRRTPARRPRPGTSTVTGEHADLGLARLDCVDRRHRRLRLQRLRRTALPSGRRPATSFTVTGLACSTGYQLEVEAFDARRQHLARAPP